MVSRIRLGNNGRKGSSRDASAIENMVTKIGSGGHEHVPAGVGEAAPPLAKAGDQHRQVRPSGPECRRPPAICVSAQRGDGPPPGDSIPGARFRGRRRAPRSARSRTALRWQGFLQGQLAAPGVGSLCAARLPSGPRRSRRRGHHAPQPLPVASPWPVAEFSRRLRSSRPSQCPRPRGRPCGPYAVIPQACAVSSCPDEPSPASI